MNQSTVMSPQHVTEVILKTCLSPLDMATAVIIKKGTAGVWLEVMSPVHVNRVLLMEALLEIPGIC